MPGSSLPRTPMPGLPAKGQKLVFAALLSAFGLLGACDGGSTGAAARDGDAELRASIERGRQAITRYPCGSCHRIPEIPAARGRIGPSLEHFGQRSYIAGHIPNGMAALQRWLQNPQALVPGTLMPDMAIPPPVARDMAAFLMSRR